MKVFEVMSRDVVTVAPDQAVTDAIRTMLKHRISGVPVVCPQTGLVGILTEGDLMRRAETGTQRVRARWFEYVLSPGYLATEYVRTHGRKVDELMTREVVSVFPETPLADVVALMEEHRIKRVPVLKGRPLAGIVSRSDLLLALLTLADKGAPLESDLAIQNAILSEIAREAWAPRATVSASVHNGDVDLWGAILDERQREALLVIAKNTPGVKSVRDQLFTIEL